MTLFFCGVMALTLLTIALYPRSYASEAKLLIRMGRESVALDPTATTGETIMLQKTQEDEVNSALNILNSREVLERVAERVGAERIIENAAPDMAEGPSANARIAQLGAWVNDTLQTLRLSDPGTPIDRAVRRLEKKSRFTAPKQSMVITVKYTAASPELAHDVVQAITEVFLEEHARLSQTEGSLEFFAEQAEKLHRQLTAAQVELRDRKNAFQRTSDSSRLSILENARDAMREKIYDLQLQESDLRSRYTDDYPLLREIRRQREAAERLLTELPAGDVRPASFAASAGTDSTVQLVHATPAATDAQPLGVDPVRKKLESEVEKINAEEYELAQLEREVELLEGKYKMHVEKLEQARVNDELGQKNIMNVKVAQPATLVHKPVSPMKTVILSLGTLLAFCGCIGLALVSESCDQTLRTTDQVEAQLGLPVLASLPYRKRRRRRRRAKKAGQQNGAPAASQAGYRSMLRALRGGSENGLRRAKTVGVVGCETAKSRSRVAGDLAIQAASSGADPVLLIDADARRRRIARRFHLNGSPGWCEIMRGNAVAKSCVKQSKLSNLAILGPGGAEADSAEPGSAVDTRGRLDDLKSDFGLVVIDLPPAGELNSSMVANMVDEVVLVVEAERTRIQAAQRARDLLKRAGIEVAGVVLANRREHIPRWLYQRL
jgi:uncharacterized protein involved in exopolysaccharide biosynthesis/Mrp family chromosome partitioning ATPase